MRLFTDVLAVFRSATAVLHDLMHALAHNSLATVLDAGTSRNNLQCCSGLRWLRCLFREQM